MTSEFRPAWWLRSPHLQTLWPSYLRRRRRLNLTRERVELADGDFIDLAWTPPARGPLVMLIHGLEGSLASHYASTVLQALNNAGFSAVFMHLRGCSGEPNRLARSYHSGATEDLVAVLDHLQATGRAPAAAIGVSLGGNLLLKHLGETGMTSGLQAAVAISVPFRLRDAARRLEQGLSRLYGRYLLSKLKQSYRVKFSRMPSPLTVDVERIATIYEFDDRITSPLHGFKGADDYYAQCSCHGYLRNIHTPTLILHARDDPFMYPHDVPAPDELGPGVELEVTPRGGHVGFITGRLPGRAQYWLDARICDYLIQTLQPA